MSISAKIIGMIIIMLSTTGYGIVLSRDIKARLKELKELKKIVFLLKGEIGFGHTPILEAFDNISRRCGEPFKSIIGNFVSYGEKSSKQPFSEIWQQGFSCELHRTHLSKDERERLADLGEELGLNDVKTQQSAIDNYAMELDMNIESLSKILPGRVKLYNSMGLMLGIVIAIIMI